jgi:hypothetical protein
MYLVLILPSHRMVFVRETQKSRRTEFQKSSHTPRRVLRSCLHISIYLVILYTTCESHACCSDLWCLSNDPRSTDGLAYVLLPPPLNSLTTASFCRVSYNFLAWRLLFTHPLLLVQQLPWHASRMRYPTKSQIILFLYGVGSRKSKQCNRNS